ncbi:MAG: glycosyltransferase family 2 protein [Alphaproteobacteria bacterium]|nr:MAG: glycosyltransferase family 2 protein [Alphaproteobacteria bacterium]
MEVRQTPAVPAKSQPVPPPFVDRNQSSEFIRVAAELAVITPALNERDNLVPLYQAIRAVLDGIDWELIIVDDDSPDGTAEAAADLARRDPRVRVLRRIGRRGLASACIEGVLSTTAPYFAIIDADMQHDERLLPEMLRRLKTDGLDMVVASRAVPGGSDEGLDGGYRKGVSGLGRRLARMVMGIELSDPMSGFFMMRRDVFDSLVRRLSGIGYKILVDILASADRPLRVVEIPYTFRRRRAGASKFGGRAAVDYLLLLLDKRLGGIVPPRFVLFCLVGGSGVVVHMAVLFAAFRGFDVRFEVAQAIATVVAMTSNFWLNNILTYSDRRLRGSAMLRGLISFYLVCSVGAVTNVGVATLLFQEFGSWILAGLAGTVVGAVWNFALSAFATWRRPGPSA